MKVKLIKQKELKNPELTIEVNLESGNAHIKLTYTCDKCAGYGCRYSGGCDDGVHLKPDEVIDTLGPEGKAMLETLFKSILNPRG